VNRGDLLVALLAAVAGAVLAVTATLASDWVWRPRIEQKRRLRDSYEADRNDVMESLEYRLPLLEKRLKDNVPRVDGIQKLLRGERAIIVDIEWAQQEILLAIQALQAPFDAWSEEATHMLFTLRRMARYHDHKSAVIEANLYALSIQPPGAYFGALYSPPIESCTEPMLLRYHAELPSIRRDVKEAAKQREELLRRFRRDA
jgi:hypothetical protein